MRNLVFILLFFCFSAGHSQNLELHSWDTGRWTSGHHSYYGWGTNFIFDLDGNVYKMQYANSTYITKSGSVFFEWESIVKLSPTGILLWKKELKHNKKSVQLNEFGVIRKLAWSDDSTIVALGISNDSLVIDQTVFNDNICFLLSVGKDDGIVKSLIYLFRKPARAPYAYLEIADMKMRGGKVFISGTLQTDLYFYNPNDTMLAEPVPSTRMKCRPLLLCFNRDGKRLWSRISGTGFFAGGHVQGSFGTISLFNNRLVTVSIAGEESDTSEKQYLSRGTRFCVLESDSNGKEISRHYFNRKNLPGVAIADVLQDNEQNLYFTGVIHDTLTFDNFTYVMKSNGNCFLLKLDKDMKVEWIRVSAVDSFSLAAGTALAVDGDNNVHVCGRYNGSVKFGGTSSPVQPYFGLFVVSYSAEGKQSFAQFPGGYTMNANSYFPFPGKIGADPCDNIYFSGTVQSSHWIDSRTTITFGSEKLTTSNYRDISFLLRNKSAGISLESRSYCTGDFVEPAGSKIYSSYDWTVDDTLHFSTRKWMVSSLSPGKHRISLKTVTLSGCHASFTDSITVLKGLSSRDTMETVNVTYVNDSTEIAISWKSMEGAVSYDVFADGEKEGSSRANSFNIKTTAAKHEFFITASDSCGNSTAPSKTFSNVFLRGENHNNQYFVLNYSAFQNWEKGVKEYEVQTLTPTGWENMGSSKLEGTFRDEIAADEISNILYRAYRVMAYESNGNLQESRSNTVYVPYEPVIFVPNAFTPNGDGLNDHFKPSAIGISTWTLKIYSRWGEKIFEGDMNSPGWDGMFKGQACSEGVFMYSVDWTGNTLQDTVPRKGISGSVQLLRFH
jgi:gliding motility-associated-like protein